MTRAVPLLAAIALVLIAGCNDHRHPRTFPQWVIGVTDPEAITWRGCAGLRAVIQRSGKAGVGVEPHRHPVAAQRPPGQRAEVDGVGGGAGAVVEDQLGALEHQVAGLVAQPRDHLLHQLEGVAQLGELGVEEVREGAFPADEHGFS